MTEATKPKFDLSIDVKHVYRVNGKRKAGVTTILKVIDKPALTFWACGRTLDMTLANPELAKSLVAQKDYQVHRSAMDHYRSVAGDVKGIGLEVHKIIEHYFKGELDQIHIDERSEPVQRCYGAFLAWANMHKLEPIGIEVLVYHDLEDYGGTADWVGLVDGKLTVIDYKTGKGIYPEAKFQAVAYAKAWERTQIWSGLKEQKVEQIIVVRIGKEDGAFDESTVTKAMLTRAFKVFQAANDIYEGQKFFNLKANR